MAKLIVEKSDVAHLEEGQKILLNQEHTLVGNTSDADVLVNVGYTRGCFGAIEATQYGYGWLFRNLGEKIGTQVNDRMGDHYLMHLDRITIGLPWAVQFIFQNPGNKPFGYMFASEDSTIHCSETDTVAV